MPRTAIDQESRHRAKRLRGDLTDAEILFWRLLKPLRDAGFAFRKQAPIGPYIADFAWLSGRLIIELDGGQHAEETVRHDAIRDDWLRGRGFLVHRVWNADLFDNPDGVMDVVRDLVTARAERMRRGSATDPTRSLRADPPREGEGEGSGTDPTPSLRADPPRKGEGEQRLVRGNTVLPRRGLKRCF